MSRVLLLQHVVEVLDASGGGHAAEKVEDASVCRRTMEGSVGKNAYLAKGTGIP